MPYLGRGFIMGDRSSLSSKETLSLTAVFEGRTVSKAAAPPTPRGYHPASTVGCGSHTWSILGII